MEYHSSITKYKKMNPGFVFMDSNYHLDFFFLKIKKGLGLVD